MNPTADYTIISSIVYDHITNRTIIKAYVSGKSNNFWYWSATKSFTRQDATELNDWIINTTKILKNTGTVAIEETVDNKTKSNKHELN